MEKFFVVVFILSSIASRSFSQIVEINHMKGAGYGTEDTKPQILTGGFVDLTSNGSIQASARLLKLHLGNPDGFDVPFYIYIGASGQSFRFPEANSTTVSNLLNPIGGIVNASFCRTGDLTKPKEYSVLRYSFQLGVKYLTGTDAARVENFDFANGFVNAGFLFQTKTWANDKAEKLGIFWISTKVISSISPKTELDRMFRKVDTNYFYGYSLDMGLEVNQMINLKLGLYQYLNNQSLSILTEPIVKVSLDYSFRK